MIKPLIAVILLSSATPASSAPAPKKTFGSRAELYRTVTAAEVLDRGRRLVHLSHTCTLRVDGGEYPVIDIQEIVKGATTPRGVNQIVVLSPGGRAVQRIEYTRQRPLFCLENRLYVWGDLAIGNVGPEGNVLSFFNGAGDVEVTRIEPNDYPLPATGARRTPPQ
jgi:hypothetical protein